MSGAGRAEDVEIEQTVIIAATSRNLVALAPVGARHTAFTGELLRVLTQGVAGAPPVVDAQTIWREVRRAQVANGRVACSGGSVRSRGGSSFVVGWPR
jgi:hypothetical protein